MVGEQSKVRLGTEAPLARFRQLVMVFVRRQRRLWIAGSVLFSVAIVTYAAIFMLPARLVSPEDLTKDQMLKARNDVRATLLTTLGGLTVAVGAYVGWRQVQLGRAQLQQNLEASSRDFDLDREGQITERFTRAIDQLGSEKLDIRLGGIYALERIARDSNADYKPIMEVLTTYLAGRSPWPPQRSGQYVAEAPTEKVPLLRSRSADLQAILTVLGRRNLLYEQAGDRLDLSRIDLRQANLEDVHLEGANVEGAHLEGANVEGAHLEGANLGRAHLEEANLGRAHLEEADLRDAHLEGAYLGGAHLEGAYLRDAHLEEANLGGAHLEGAYLRDAHLEGAYLGDTHLDHADLGGAHLEGAILGGAYLEEATLGGAHLDEAYLGGANLEGADLATVIGLTDAQIDRAVINSTTKLPVYMMPAKLEKPPLEA